MKSSSVINTKSVPQFEIVNRSTDSIRYLEHGWPSDLCRWHAHNAYELHLITETKGKTVIGDFIGQFCRGDLFLIGPLLPHNWISYDSQPAVEVRDRLIQFEHQTLVSLCDIFPEYNVLKSLLNQSKYGVKFVGYDARLANEQLIQIRNSTDIRRINCFLQLLESLLNHPTKKSLSGGLKFSKMNEIEENRISHIVDYVIGNYQEKITINKIAKYANMSSSNFSRYFRHRTGECFSEFINKVRISHACNLLLESDLKISAICYEVGFNNVSHFNRYFLKVKGVRPRDFRQQVRREFL